MRILRVISSMDPELGGPGEGIRNSIAELQKSGVINEVVCLDASDAAFLSRDHFPVHALGKGKGPWYYNKRLIQWLVENMERFDFIIVHGLWLYHGYATRKALRVYKRRNPGKTGPALYVMPHGMLDPYFQLEKTRKLKAIRNNIYWSLVERHIINNANGILFTCEEELRLARHSFKPYAPKKELNIGYGILKPGPFDEGIAKKFLEVCPTTDGRPYLLFLSRIHPKKGVDMLIEAYRELKEQKGDIPMLVIAGPGLETGYGSKIRKLAEGEKDIVFPGMLKGQAKWAAFYGCDAFILPSHQENFGIAVVEAMACGKPVLITNKINIYREIENGGAGIIADDTKLNIAGQLKAWTKMSQEDRKKMSRAAKNVFENSFSVAGMAKKMLELFKD